MADWIPKEGDYVTTELFYGLANDRHRIEGKIQIVRVPTPNELPIKVGGFWFTQAELTHRPDLTSP